METNKNTTPLSGRNDIGDINGGYAAQIKNVLRLLLAAAGALILGEILNIGYFMVMFRIIPQNEYTTNMIELFGFIFITIAVILFAKKIYKSSWYEIGFVRRGAAREFVIGIALGGAVFTACVIILFLFKGVKIENFNFTPVLLLQFIPLLLAWCVQSNAEEVLSRGFLFFAVSRKSNIYIGIIVSSGFFAAMHLGNEGMGILPILDLSLFGIFAALYMVKRGNIWAPSGFHAGWNCFQGNVFAFPVSGSDAGEAFIEVSTHGPDWLSGGAFGVEGSIVSILVQTVIILKFVYDIFFKNKGRLEF